jgi:hypothetical protein
LLAASAQLCAAAEADETLLDLHYWEGYEAKANEEVTAQFVRQLSEDLTDPTDTGVHAAASAWLPLAHSFVRGLLAMYNGSLVAAERRLFYLRVQINSGNACIKFHDDFVTVRMVSALCGDSTVVAPPAATDWRLWKKTNGQLAMTDLSSEVERQTAVLRFNEQVCPPDREVRPPAGDVLLLKGGKLTTRPCVHRAPYSADTSCCQACSPNHRLLITLDYITLEECSNFIDMHAQNDEDDMD